MAIQRDEDFDRMVSDFSRFSRIREQRPVQSFMEATMSNTYSSSTNDGTNYVEYLDSAIERLQKLEIEETKPPKKKRLPKEKVSFQFDPEELIDG